MTPARTALLPEVHQSVVPNRSAWRAGQVGPVRRAGEMWQCLATRTVLKNKCVINSETITSNRDLSQVRQHTGFELCHQLRGCLICVRALPLHLFSLIQHTHTFTYVRTHKYSPIDASTEPPMMLVDVGIVPTSAGEWKENVPAHVLRSPSIWGGAFYPNADSNAASPPTPEPKPKPRVLACGGGGVVRLFLIRGLVVPRVHLVLQPCAEV